MPKELKSDFSGSALSFYGRDHASGSLTDFISSHKEVDRWSMFDFLLHGAILPPRTPLIGVSQLYPGEVIGGTQSDLSYAGLNLKILRKNMSWFVDEFDRLLGEYVAAESDISTVLLSGGIDSAILLSYLPKGATCITWGGRGPQTDDVSFSKVTASAFGVDRHEFAFADFDHDLALYEEAVRKLGFPLLFAGVVPFLRMAETGKAIGVSRWLVGQNADTLFMAYPAPVLAKRLSFLNKALPWNPLQLLPDRRSYLFSTSSIPRLMAYFKSLAVFPGDWISIPDAYFEEKEELLRQLSGKNRDQSIILYEELLSEARRNQINQNEIPSLYGINSSCPYYDRSVVELALGVPPAMRRAGRYGKLILKELAKKRGVPEEVIYKKKTGLSYGFEEFIGTRKHLPIWKRMEEDSDLNALINVSAIRDRHQDNYHTFMLLMSLHYWFELVARPKGLKISTLSDLPQSEVSGGRHA